MDQSAFTLRTTALLLLVACVTDAETVTPYNVYVHVGDPINLLCLKASGSDRMKWLRDDRTIDFEMSSPRVTEESDAVSSTLSISRAGLIDQGNYTCRQLWYAIGRLQDTTTMVHVQEHPEVYLSLKEQSVSKGQRMTVSCNVTGHPQPQLRWINKQNGQTLDSTSGRVRVLDGVLMIDDVAPSDGGLYSCMAVSPSGNASGDIRLKTQPGLPDALSVSPGPTSVYFSLQTPPISGGTPITAFALHARLGPADKWAETVIPASDPLVIAGLRPYTSYSVRLAAINTVGVGPFSQTHTVQTQGIQHHQTTPPSTSHTSSDDVPHNQLLKAVTDIVAGLKDINETLERMEVLNRRLS